MKPTPRSRASASRRSGAPRCDANSTSFDRTGRLVFFPLGDGLLETLRWKSPRHQPDLMEEQPQDCIDDGSTSTDGVMSFSWPTLCAPRTFPTRQLSCRRKRPPGNGDSARSASSKSAAAVLPAANSTWSGALKAEVSCASLATAATTAGAPSSFLSRGSSVAGLCYSARAPRQDGLPNGMATGRTGCSPPVLGRPTPRGVKKAAARGGGLVFASPRDNPAPGMREW